MFNILRLIGILAIAEIFCLYWDALFKQLEMSNLYTQMLTFAIVDLLTIRAISYYPVKFLTKAITFTLYLSIIAHNFGAYCWVSYNTCINIYDMSKEWIFYLELMAFIAYGTYSGGKRICTLAFAAGVDDMAHNSGNNADN